MKTKLLINMVLLLAVPAASLAQYDSSLVSLQDLSLKYIHTLERKIDKYSSRITGKTEKTLTKLSSWEKKLQPALEKIDPETANDLFGPGTITFTLLLQKLNEGQAIANGYRSQYNEYRDKLNTSLKYLDDQQEKIRSNIIKPVKSAAQKMNQLEADVKNSEVIEEFIKERKQKLIATASKYLGKNKYLEKISKESYYYTESIKNYKEIFSDPQKIEGTATALLRKIPGFTDFMEKSNGLSSLFANPLSGGGSSATGNYAALGYQTNASIVQDLQHRNSIGPSIQELTQTHAVSLNSPMQQLQNHLPGSGSSVDMPQFKPNDMKSKTFKQRIQFGTSLQFSKATNFLPGTADIGLQLSYKLNTKSSIGLGTAYKLGLGNGISNVKLSSQGIALRSFIDWKLKSNFFVNGGFEYNYNTAFRSFADLSSSVNSPAVSLWKPAALIGINKKYNLGKVKANMMLLYDFLAKQRAPETQQIVFRFGYSL